MAEIPFFGAGQFDAHRVPVQLHVQFGVQMKADLEPDPVTVVGQRLREATLRGDIKGGKRVFSAQLIAGGCKIKLSQMRQTVGAQPRVMAGKQLRRQTRRRRRGIGRQETGGKLFTRPNPFFFSRKLSVDGTPVMRLAHVAFT